MVISAMTRRSAPPSAVRRRACSRSRARRSVVAVAYDRGRARASPAPTVTTHTPVMGPNLLNAAQLARWFNVGARRAAERARRCTTTSPRSRRPSSTKVASRACAATSRSCSRSSRPAGSASRARRSRPTRTTSRGSTRSTAAPGLPNCTHGDSSPSRCFATAEHRCAHADPAAAQLRGRHRRRTCRTG